MRRYSGLLSRSRLGCQDVMCGTVSPHQVAASSEIRLHLVQVENSSLVRHSVSHGQRGIGEATRRSARVQRTAWDWALHAAWNACVRFAPPSGHPRLTGFVGAAERQWLRTCEQMRAVRARLVVRLPGCVSQHPLAGGSSNAVPPSCHVSRPHAHQSAAVPADQ